MLNIKKIETQLSNDKLEKTITYVKKILKAQNIICLKLKLLVKFLSFKTKMIIVGCTFLHKLFNAWAKWQFYYCLNTKIQANFN